MKNIKFTDSKGRAWEYSIPFEITCTVTGAVKKYTSEEYINNKIERFDGLENLRKTYVCRDAKKGTKTTTTPANGKPKINLEQIPVAPQPKIEPFKPTPPVPLTKETASPETCYNPAYLLDGKPCNTCAFMSICTYEKSPKGKLKKAKK